MTFVMWLICITAAIGFLFDTYPLLMAPLVVPPALEEMGVKKGTPEFETWNGIFLFVPALVGGAFGLIGGYLTDRFGRRRMLVWSINLYALSAFFSGFSTSLAMLLALRCTTFIGVCVEFVAAVAWLAELFPNPEQREKVLGYTQLFGSLGGLLVAEVNLLFSHVATSLPALPLIPESAAGGQVWRYVLISGVVPAIPLIIVRPFLPESPAWAQKKAAGTLKRPSFAEIFAPGLRKTTLVSALLFACTLGAAFGALQQGPRLLGAHPSLKALTPPQKGKQMSHVQMSQEIGGLVGRLALAIIIARIASRRRVLQMFLIPGLIVVPIVYLLPTWGQVDLFKWGVALAGFFTVAQLSFWGNYLPVMYPMRLRGTGESFAANVGGRMIGTSAAMLTTSIAAAMATSRPDPASSAHLATAAAMVGGGIYLVAVIASFWLPEPQQAELPD